MFNSCNLLNCPPNASFTARMASSCVLPSLTNADDIVAVIVVIFSKLSDVAVMAPFDFKITSSADAPTAVMSTLRNSFCRLSILPLKFSVS